MELMETPSRPASPLHSIKATIRARDFDRARAFYAQVLSLPVAEEWDSPGDRGCIFQLGDGGYLEVSAASADPRSQASHQLEANDKVELQIRTDSLDAWVERFTGRVAMEGPVSRPWGHRYLWIRDPDGVRIALFEGRY